uniref:Toprim domain-containing protein n=1 Tax=uncultured prokaryote TaxID=198431 RepID=A0A0H5Q210_9ZZZZ|nr:hypothetical protein [uncultured prokaryote]
MVNVTCETIMDALNAAFNSAGLVVEGDIDLTGSLATCGTTKKPHGTDGRYAVHLDFPPNVWLCNYHDGGEGRTVYLYDRSMLDAMPEAEREALRERIRQEKEAAIQRRDAAHKAAANKARGLWPTFTPAGEDNAYLKRKGCVPIGDLRQDAEGRLVLSVKNAEGRIVSLQFISGDGQKRFLKGGEKAGCFFPIPAKNGGQGGPLLIGEGIATVLSACMATEHAGLVAFDAFNIEAVARVARSKYPEREIVILADNDIHDTGGRNTGVEEGTKAAQAVGGKLAICPAIDGHKADFNDLHTSAPDGLEKVRQVIEVARQEQSAQPLPGSKKAYRCLNVAELIGRDYPPRSMLLSPVMAIQSLSMIFAMRGVGKTFFALSCAYAVASGGGVFSRWFAPYPAKVLYIDGEMPAVTLQERLKSIALSSEADITDPDNLRILTPDEQDGPMPNLGTKEGQAAVEPFLDGVALVVVDNIATLARTGKANDEDSWIPVQEWLLTLRRRGISVLLVHHAGKNGSQRGTGAKEDILDTVIELKRPSDYRTEQGARFEVHFTKARGMYGSDTEPFEAMLTIDDQGQCSWTTRKVEDLVEMRVVELLEAGFSERDIAEELKDDHVGRTRIRRIRQELESKGKVFFKSKGGAGTHRKEANQF